MKIIFLDYDGVVNNLVFQDINGEPNFNFPKLEQVNDKQAVAWLNKICREFDAKIVVFPPYLSSKNPAIGEVKPNTKFINGIKQYEYEKSNFLL